MVKHHFLLVLLLTILMCESCHTKKNALVVAHGEQTTTTDVQSHTSLTSVLSSILELEIEIQDTISADTTNLLCLHMPSLSDSLHDGTRSLFPPLRVRHAKVTARAVKKDSIQSKIQNDSTAVTSSNTTGQTYTTVQSDTEITTQSHMLCVLIVVLSILIFFSIRRDLHRDNGKS